MQPGARSSRRVGRYHLGEPLGGGPSGEVFRAKIYGVAGFEREFALKRIHPGLLDVPGARRALEEAARRWAALEHPRIARLHEHDFQRPDAFVAAELVSGLDAGSLVAATHGQGEPLAAGAATAILGQAARAVGYAHTQGVVHAGLCPTNLIGTPGGEIKVTDFGLLPPRLPPSPAEDATLVGRLPYLAPEQMAGAPATATSDVFALGALFYELLTGERAFAGASGAEIAAALGSPPDTAGVPRPLAQVLERCFARAPTDRFPNAAALADELEAATRGMLMRGDSRDVGRVVRQALDKLESMRRGQVSGVLSFPVPRPPPPGQAKPAPLPAAGLGVPNLELDDRVSDESPQWVNDEDLLEESVDLATDVRAMALPPPAPTQPPAPAEPLPMPPPVPAPGAEASPPAAAGTDLGITTPFIREPPPADDFGAAPEPAPAFGEAFLASSEPGPWGRRMLVGAALLALGAIGFFGYLLIVGDEASRASTGRPDAAPRASAAPADAGPPEPPPVDAAPPPTELSIASEPSGAAVYLDGTRVGETPVELEPTSDRHRLALILPGYKLHTDEIDGAGEVAVKLEEVTPGGGRAGIKVRCHKKNRYYVFIDGHDAGQLCPTERLGVDMGPHAVEIYDPVTDTRRRFDVVVKQTRLSHRVYVD